MNATFDPKFLMDLSIFKIGGCNKLTPSKHKLLEEFMYENVTCSDQYMKKLMSLHVHVMMQCCMRQHFADRYWLHEPSGGHASERNFDEEVHN